MLRNARTWIALAVIAGGVIAAIVLPKDEVPTTTPDRQSPDGLVRRDFNFDEAIAQAHGAEPAASRPSESSGYAPHDSGASPLDVHHPPPRLEDEIPGDGHVGEHRLSPEVFQDLAQRPIRRGADDEEHAAKGPLQHKIVDGDTLRSLAKRYLGSETRFMEIFEANRDRLSNPEVLPIGVKLLIPLGTAPVPTVAAPRVEASPVSVGLVGSPSSGAGSEAAPMVEIPPGTLRSVPADSTGSPQTYRVREGDTLVSIARDLYGDGRKYREIFDANRDLLTSPNTLPTGVLLQIP